jgi:hypothetical protein
MASVGPSKRSSRASRGDSQDLTVRGLLLMALAFGAGVVTWRWPAAGNPTGVAFAVLIGLERLTSRAS